MDTDRLGIVITAACLLLFFFVVPMSGLLNNGYVVTPATDADIANSTPLETVEVSFWDLSPREMLIVVALSLSPLLLYPLELFFFIKMFAYLGYRKITAASVLTNATRSRIYETIVADPGIYFNELVRQTGVARSTLRYHIALLKMTGKITASKTGSDVRYFENSGKFSEAEQKILAFLHNDRERFICEYLIRNPATTRGDLEKVLGISGAAVTWHTNRLRDAGVLAVTKTGRTVQYSIAQDAARALDKYHPQVTGPGSNAEVLE
ncbi:winged helix-turn-helix transcriptional regulator [Methanoregula sp.]|uniref:winged helix-turn-helix transcriptional regulator n=1 Tax=Methanoregula sp. TaxID=2052170 RepID=UPI0035629E5A